MLTWCELCLLLLIMVDKNSINYGNLRAGFAPSHNVQGATCVIIRTIRNDPECERDNADC